MKYDTDMTLYPFISLTLLHSERPNKIVYNLAFLSAIGLIQKVLMQQVCKSAPADLLPRPPHMPWYGASDL